MAVVSGASSNRRNPRLGRGWEPLRAATDLTLFDGDGPGDLRVESERLAQLSFEPIGTDASRSEFLADGNALLTIHAETRPKLEQARAFAAETPPVRVLPRDEASIERV